MLVLNEMRVSVNSLNAENKENGDAVVNLSILVSNISLLNELMKRIRKIPAILDVYRVGSA